MITSYKITLGTTSKLRFSPDQAYYMYACLLSKVSEQAAGVVHDSETTPVSQYMTKENGRIIWNVSLLGRFAEEQFAPVIESENEYFIKSISLLYEVEEIQKCTVAEVDDLLKAGAKSGREHTLEFVTPTVFKSRGKYVILPSSHLIVQNLIKKWNGCFPDCPIEDEDGEGSKALADGLVVKDYSLRSAAYGMKRTEIPGFTGKIRLYNSMSGFHHDFANALLDFAGFSGIGAKTALGMGGVLH